MNGGTISKGGSGGTELADASTQSLFEYLWNSHSNLICPMDPPGTVRGVSAVQDFNDGKKLTLPDMRGRAPFGVDAMGNGAPSTGVGSNLIAPAYVDTPIPAPGIARDTVGAVGGDDDIALATAQMPAHSHTATGVPVDGAIPAKPALKAPNHGHPWQANECYTWTGNRWLRRHQYHRQHRPDRRHQCHTGRKCLGAREHAAVHAYHLPDQALKHGLL
jgi:hypothetical protein